MGDVFIEQIVKKQNEMKDILRNSAIITGGILLAAVVFLFLLTSFPYKEYVGTIVFLIFAGILYYTWYIVSGLNLEYEYIFTNGELDIDKISNKRKRKRLTTVRMSRVDKMDVYDAKKADPKKYDHVYTAAISSRAEGNWYMEYSNRDGEKCCLIFTPNEKVLDAIKKFYRPRVHSA